MADAIPGVATIGVMQGMQAIQHGNKQYERRLKVGDLAQAKAFAGIGLEKEDLAALKLGGATQSQGEEDMGDSFSVRGDTHITMQQPDTPPTPPATAPIAPNKSTLGKQVLGAAVVAGSVLAGTLIPGLLKQPDEVPAGPAVETTAPAEDQDTKYQIGVSGGARE